MVLVGDRDSGSARHLARQVGPQGKATFLLYNSASSSPRQDGNGLPCSATARFLTAALHLAPVDILWRGRRNGRALLPPVCSPGEAFMPPNHNIILLSV